MKTTDPFEICFVCLGNICRSPLAQGVFERLVQQEGLAATIKISSAGTGNWHVGQPPDARMQATANNKGIELNSRAQQFLPGHFHKYHLVLAMDQSNKDVLENWCTPEVAQTKLRLFRSFDPKANGRLNVPDPYYGGDAGFENVFQIVHRTCPKILDFIKDQISPSA